MQCKTHLYTLSTMINVFQVAQYLYFILISNGKHISWKHYLKERNSLIQLKYVKYDLQAKKAQIC